jgi:hypothetical protein
MASTSLGSVAPSVVLGAQRPRICHVPASVDGSGDEAIELAARVGLKLDDWQQFVLGNSLGERADGKWAAQTVGLCVGRQNGKGSVLEARELAGLFLLDEQLIIHTAHLQKTATNHFRRLRNLIRTVPEYERRVVSAPTGKGSEAIHLDSGQIIFFATRQGGGGKGLTADLIVYDEAMYLSEQDRASLAPTLAARSMSGNIQTWYVGSAVDQQDSAHDGVPFAQVRESGMAAAKGVAYFEWSIPWHDPDTLPAAMASDPSLTALANPGQNIRISTEWMEHERAVELGARSHAVERCGVGDWPDASGDSKRVIGRDDWDACAERDRANAIVSGWALAIDTNVDQTWATIAIAGLRADGLGQVAVAHHDRATDWIVDRCLELLGEHPGAPVVVQKLGPAANLIDPLKAHGVQPVEMSMQEYEDACADFTADAANGRLRYPFPQPELTDALIAARKHKRGDRWTWARRSSAGADISPLVACTLARWGVGVGGKAPRDDWVMF